MSPSTFLRFATATSIAILALAAPSPPSSVTSATPNRSLNGPHTVDQLPPGDYRDACPDLQVSGYSLRGSCYGAEAEDICPRLCLFQSQLQSNQPGFDLLNAVKQCVQDCNLSYAVDSEIDFRTCVAVTVINSKLACRGTVPLPSPQPIAQTRITFNLAGAAPFILDNVGNFEPIPHYIVQANPTSLTICTRYHSKVYLYDVVRGAVLVATVNENNSGIDCVDASVALIGGMEIGISRQS